MESSMHYLAEHLQQLLNVHRELLGIFAKKRRAISERDVVGLEAVLHREEGIISSIRRLKESTSAILEKLAERFHVPPDDSLMEVIAARMETGLRVRFQTTMSDLTRSAREIASNDILRAPLVKDVLGLPAHADEGRQDGRPGVAVPSTGRARRRIRVLTGQPA